MSRKAYNGSMASLTDYLSPDQILISLGLLLILIEVVMGVSTGFDLLLLGSILVAGGFIGGLTGNLMLALATIIALSILYFWLGRSAIKKKLIVATQATNVDNLVGKTAVVIKTVKPHQPGQVRYDTEHWRASSEEVIDIGERVTINSVEGVTLNVSRLKN